MPMEKEIAALKDKLTEAEDKVKELEASKVWNIVIHLLKTQDFALMQWAKVRITKWVKTVI